jgi:hypothetical protein
MWGEMLVKLRVSSGGIELAAGFGEQQLLAGVKTLW